MITWWSHVKCNTAQSRPIQSGAFALANRTKWSLALPRWRRAPTKCNGLCGVLGAKTRRIHWMRLACFTWLDVCPLNMRWWICLRARSSQANKLASQNRCNEAMLVGQSAHYQRRQQQKDWFVLAIGLLLVARQIRPFGWSDSVRIDQQLE